MNAIPPDKLAAITIWQEARGESFEGKLAVAQVIRNRMKRQYNSDGTVAGTVLRPHQFSGWNTNSVIRAESMLQNEENKTYISCQSAWAHSKDVYSTFFPAVLYHSKNMAKYPDWAYADNVKMIAVIGNHIFYDEVR